MILNVIKPHSFIDVITNSSTELFVCNTDKTIETVKEILNTLIVGYNTRNETNYSLDVFNEPYVFDLKAYREWRKSEFDHQWGDKFNNIQGWFYDDGDEEDMKYLRKEYIEEGDSSNWGMGTRSTKPFAERIRMESCDEDGKWDYKRKDEAVNKIYKEILKDKSEKPNWWTEPWKYSYHNRLVKDLDGCVIITGSGDNSVPYDIWEYINTLLNGQNYHLG